MNDVDLDVIDRMLGHSLTSHPVDLKRAAFVLRATDNDPQVVALVIHKRRLWLDWLSMTQRQWQSRSRRPTRVQQYRYRDGELERCEPDSPLVKDSIATRERYVRCTQ